MPKFDSCEELHPANSLEMVGSARLPLEHPDDTPHSHKDPAVYQRLPSLHEITGHIGDR